MTFLDPSISHEVLRSVPIFPLPSVVLLPSSVLPLHIFEPRYRDMIRDALASALPIIMAQPIALADTTSDRPPLYPVAGIGKILQHEQLPDGRYNLLLAGVARIRIIEELPAATAYRQVRAEIEPDRVEDSARVEELLQMLMSCALGLRTTQPEAAQGFTQMLDDSQGTGAIADRFAAALVREPAARQQLLEEVVVDRRLETALGRVTELMASNSPRQGAGMVH